MATTTRTKPRKTQGITKKVTSIRRSANLRGIKGGTSAAQQVQNDMQKEIPQMFQKYADKTLKTANKMGLKGGVAILAGSAAGMVLGAAIGTAAGAAMNSMKTNQLAKNTLNTAESIRRHADDLKKFTGKKEDKMINN
jgi:hypothetical protein